ncbi:hypothetical protein VB005_01710 [Metarhizium brunneum]
MKFSASILAIVSLAASSVAGGVTTQLTLCQQPNLQDCDDQFVPIDSCYKVPECEVQSLNTGGHVCDFYSHDGCSGNKYQYAGIQQNLPPGTTIRSVFCW